jgi:hypothetical protein
MKQLVELGDGRRASVHVFGEGDALLYFPGGPGFPAMLPSIEAPKAFRSAVEAWANAARI